MKTRIEIRLRTLSQEELSLISQVLSIVESKELTFKFSIHVHLWVAGLCQERDSHSAVSIMQRSSLST